MNGIIYDIDLNIRTFSLEIGHNLKYFYVTNSLMKKFKKYLYPGTMVTFVYNPLPQVHYRRTIYHL